MRRTNLLPDIHTIGDYRKVFGKAETWDRAIHAICERYSLPFGEFEIQKTGSHIVYVRDSHEVIKLYCPLFGGDYVNERVVMEWAHGRLGVDTPMVLQDGELEGWSYVVTSFVEGTPIQSVWPEIDHASRVALSRQIGEAMALWHALPIDGLGALDVDWRSFVQTQVNVAVISQRGRGLGEEWLSQVAEFMNSFVDSDFIPSKLVLLNGDFTDEHVYVTHVGGAWRFTGLIDFGDAMLGHPEYDFVAPTIEIMAGEGECQRALFAGYGYGDEYINDQLRRRLMSWSLLHRFADVPHMLGKVAPFAPPKTIDELARVVWNF